jgi:hypothetical protein
VKFGAKYKSLIQHNGRFDILEGTTFSGKTTVGFGVKLMLEIIKSKEKFHGICGQTMGVVEKNILNSERGICNVWGDYVEYNPRGKGNIRLPHLEFRQTDNSVKIVYIFGYDDATRWKHALGGQLGCLGVDEANIADMDFLREASIRQNYMLWTLNPDNPDLDIYQEYINTARPLQQYAKDYPQEILQALTLPHIQGRTHWYFTFHDNIACTPEKRQQIIANAPVGSKLYKNKILGLRGVGEGALYANYMANALVPADGFNYKALVEVMCSVDMGSATGDDTKHAHTIATVAGLTKAGRVVVLKCKVIDSIDLSSVVQQVDALCMPYWSDYWTKFSKIVIDYGDSGGLLVRSWKALTRFKNVSIRPARKSGKVAGYPKEITLVTRAQLKAQMLMHNALLWSTDAIDSYNAHLNILSNDIGAELEQSNIANDYADSLTYILTENWVKVSKIQVRKG